MAEHTPTPWEHTEGDIWVDTREQVCCGRGYNECCGEPDVRGGQDLIAQSNPVDAAFIIKAVNNHDALVAALKESRAALIAFKDAVEASQKMNGREYVGLGIQVNNAIGHAWNVLQAVVGGSRD